MSITKDEAIRLIDKDVVCWFDGEYIDGKLLAYCAESNEVEILPKNSPQPIYAALSVTFKETPPMVDMDHSLAFSGTGDVLTDMDAEAASLREEAEALGIDVSGMTEDEYSG